MKSKHICMIAMLLLSLSSTAQVSRTEMAKRRAAEKVAQMCDYIEFVYNPQNKYDERSFYKDKAVNLFINRCGPYTEDGREKKGVIMETTSKYRPRPTRRLMKDYFEGILHTKYAKVQMEFTDVSHIQVSNLKKIDDGKYVCTCTIEQAFAGFSKDGIPLYKDITRKEIKCYVYVEEVVGGEELIVLLGDVYAKETR